MRTFITVTDTSRVAEAKTPWQDSKSFKKNTVNGIGEKVTNTYTGYKYCIIAKHTRTYSTLERTCRFAVGLFAGLLWICSFSILISYKTAKRLVTKPHDSIHFGAPIEQSQEDLQAELAKIEEKHAKELAEIEAEEARRLAEQQKKQDEIKEIRRQRELELQEAARVLEEEIRQNERKVEEARAREHQETKEREIRERQEWAEHEAKMEILRKKVQELQNSNETAADNAKTRHEEEEKRIQGLEKQIHKKYHTRRREITEETRRKLRSREKFT